jgi:hypothetical protein
MTCTVHFARRVRERIGAATDPHDLAKSMIWAIENARTDLVQFVCRTDKQGLRVFRFCVPETTRTFFALVDTNTMTCITVLPPGFLVGRQGKSHLELKDIPT